MAIKLEINGKQIARVDVANVSGLAEDSEYTCVVTQDDAQVPARQRRFSVRHRRSDGALALAAKVLLEVAS
jgi:hypothetical protein